MKIKVVIPSYERASWFKNRTTNTLANIYKIQYCSELKPILYIRKTDTELKLYEKLAIKYNCELVLLKEKNILGAAQTYDSIIELFKNDYDVLIILDDDLNFKIRNEKNYPMYRTPTIYELAQLLKHTAYLVDEKCPAMTLTPSLSRTQPTIIKYKKPLQMGYIFYLPFFKKYPYFRFWKGKEIEARCDLNLTLNLLESGFLTAFFTPILIPPNVNNPGGCSTYRSFELECQSINYLIKHHSQFVTKRYKHNKSWKRITSKGKIIEDVKIPRPTITVHWRRAFNEEMFEKRFNISSKEYMFSKIKNYEKTYIEFFNDKKRLIEVNKNVDKTQ